MPQVNSPIDLTFIDGQLSELGLVSFGALALEGRSHGYLVGNAGPDMWSVFSRSEEASDSKPNPLDRWTRRNLEPLAKDARCKVEFPFDQPFPPFQQYAKKAAHVGSSPLGLLIHPRFGLWHAFRALLVFPEAHPVENELQAMIQGAQKMIHPCDECSQKPCLTSCPVNAFSSNGLNVESCFGHLRSDDAPRCMSVGCAARNACPVGKEYQYSPEQVAFHMQSYFSAD